MYSTVSMYVHALMLGLINKAMHFQSSHRAVDGKLGPDVLHGQTMK